MHVVVYEPMYRGHHLAYMAHVLPALSQLPCKVTLATSSDARDSTEFQLHLDPCRDQFELAPSFGVGRPGMQGMKEFRRGLWKCVRELKPDHLYVAYGDALAQYVGLMQLFGQHLLERGDTNTELEVLLMRGKYVYPAKRLRDRNRARIARWLVRRGPWRIIHHLDPHGVVALCNGTAASRDRIRLLPDPIERVELVGREEARKQLGIPIDGIYVGVAGMIDTRKGADRLLCAFRAALGSLPHDARLLLAGPIADPVREILHGECADIPADRLVLVDRHLSSHDMNLAIQSLDLVCTPYPSHEHSASIVIRAAVCERPVLAADIGWMRRTVKQFDLGQVCSVRDTNQFASRLISAMDEARDYQQSESARRFAAYHASDNFAAHWTAHLRERLGEPPAEEFRSWDGVLEAAT